MEVETGRRRRKGQVSIAALLLGLLFASGGFGLLYFGASSLYDGWAMRSWVPVQAELLEVALKGKPGGKGSHRATASYRYAWRGESHTATRVGVTEISDNIGDWQQRTFQPLAAARAAGEPITVWVNPASPGEAVIDRSVRWGIIAFVLFLGLLAAGLGLLILLAPWLPAADKPAVTTVETLLQSNRAWRNNRILSEGKGEVKLLWWAGSLLLLLSGNFLFRYEEFIADGLSPKLLLFLFPLMALWLLIQAVMRTLRWHRFGNAVLHLSPFPGTLGGRVAGSVDLPLSTTGQAVRVTLSCIHVYWRYNGKKNEKREDILWQDERQRPLQPGAQGGRIAFDFAPPRGLPESSAGREHHKWEISLEAELAGPDLALRFLIPVIDGKGATAAESVAVEHAPSAHNPVPLPAWLKLTHRAGALEYTLPVLRNSVVDLPLTLIGGLFFAAGLLIPRLTGIFGVQSLIPLAFTLIGGGIFLGGLYSLGNSLQVRISPMGVELLRRVFGIPFHRRIAAAELAGIYKRIGSGVGGKAFYWVVVTAENGRTVRVADALEGAGVAETLIGEIRRYLKLEPLADNTPLLRRAQFSRKGE